MKRIAAVIFVSLVGLFIMLPHPAGAQTVQDFTIEHFHGRYELFNDTRGGRMSVSEELSVVFTANNHGLLRAIPNTYKNQNLHLIVDQVLRDGQPEEFSTYQENDNTILKIGSATRTVTGKHVYSIDYKMRNVINFHETHDEWYWDINGDDWNQKFLQVTGEVVFPEGWDDLDTPSGICFTGSFGATTQDCSLRKTDRGYAFTTSRTLSVKETLTIVASSQKGLFKPLTLVDKLLEYWPLLAGTVVPPGIIGVWAYRRWVKHGKDLRGKGTIIPEYGPPKNLSPAEAAVVTNYSLSARDVSATIIDLAIHKYIKIHEITKKKLLKDKKTYELELTNPDWSQLKEHESEILRDIFVDPELNQRVEIDSLKNKFYKTIQHLQTAMPKSLTHAGYFTTNPRTAGSFMYGVGIALVILGFFLLFVPGILLSGIIVLIFAALMPKRTVEGVAVKEGMNGLKMYMDVAEKDRIKMLQSPDAPYAVSSPAPKKTVELFEKLLPFAIILGVEKGWAEQFKDIYTTPPDWYSGSSMTGFNTGLFVGSLHNSVSAMTTNFSAPSSSSGSGFSGGGFSGGGGGGGGGGGW